MLWQRQDVLSSRNLTFLVVFQSTVLLSSEHTLMSAGKESVSGNQLKKNH